MGDPRFGSVALRDVDRRDDDTSGSLIGQPPGKHRDIDQASIGLAMVTGAAHHFGVADHLGLVLVAGNLRERHAENLRLRIAVMLEGGRVDGLELQSFAVIDIHWNGIALEQQAERRFALLHFRDVDANADRSAVARAAFVDHDPTSVGEPLLVTLTGIGQ